MSRPPWHSMAFSLGFTPFLLCVRRIRVHLDFPRDRVVVATVVPCRSWHSLRADSTTLIVVASSSSSSALVPDVHYVKASSRRSEPFSSFLLGFQASPESLRLRDLSCFAGPCAGGQSALLDRVTRLFDRPVCVTCGAILLFSMPVLSRHWHIGVVVSASAEDCTCHVLRVATVALCALHSFHVLRVAGSPVHCSVYCRCRESETSRTRNASSRSFWTRWFRQGSCHPRHACLQNQALLVRTECTPRPGA